MPKKSSGGKRSVWIPVPSTAGGYAGGVISAPPKRQETFPKLAQYIHLASNGNPFATVGGAIDPVQIARAAKFDYLVLDSGNNTEINMNIREAIRAINSDIKIIDYLNVGRFATCGGDFPLNPEPGGCSHTNFAWAKWEAIGKDIQNLIQKQEDSEPWRFFTNFGIDLAKAGIAEAMATEILKWVMVDPKAYALFLDETCRGISFLEGAGNTIDYAASGPYEDSGMWDSGYAAGVDTLYARLRPAMAPERLLIGNGGITGPTNNTINGWMRENWPLQGPSDASIQKFRDDVAACLTPSIYFLTIWKDNTATPMPSLAPPYVTVNYSSTDKLRARHALGVSCLVDGGLGCLVGTSSDNARGFCYDFWLDEFSVNSAGVATTDISGKWWLGRRTAATAMQNGMHYASFQNGYVVCNDTGSAQTFTPPTSSKRIKGADSGNDGSAVGTVAVSDDQSIFLVRNA